MLQESRNGGQLALREYSYQFLYSCYLMLSAINENGVFHLEGIEDIDYIICADDKKTITHIRLKYSTVKQDVSFMSSVLKNFLWDWDAYDFDDFNSKISFENVEKKSPEDSVERALIKMYDITTGNIRLFANGIKMFCVDRMENRGENTLKEIQKCIEAIRFDIRNC
ncbi:MAG: hypothetical protein K2N34_03715 [Lachnospiraceae bacterium]|nr:hypothetical protein [Lachnospiraceae bacterium]